jgi:hypothetical protein
MKCVQIVGQGVSCRMSDDDAFQIVDRDHDGQYCPKTLWKNHYDLHHKERFYVDAISPTGCIIAGTDEGFHAREAEHATRKA